MNEHPLAIGIDFGGTSIKTGVVRGSEIIDHAPPIATQDFGSPDELIEMIVRVVEDLRIHHQEIKAVGVGMPGFVNSDTGTVFGLTNVRGWENVELKSKLEAAFNLPVSADNDANCMAYAEWKLGAGQGCADLVCVALGTGVGGGVIANGQMVRGMSFAAGEIGQSSIDYQGRVGHYGNLGALEDYIGNNEIARDAQQAYRDAGIVKHIKDCSPAALSEAANRGDQIALDRWNMIARMLATSMMNTCWLLNPEAIVIGGGVARAGDLLFEPFRNHLFKQLSGPFKDKLAVRPAAFGHEAGTVGAAALALENARA